MVVVFEHESSASGHMVVGDDGISRMGESQINSITTWLIPAVWSHIFNGNVPLQAIPEAVIIRETKVGKDQLDR